MLTLQRYVLGQLEQKGKNSVSPTEGCFIHTHISDKHTLNHFSIFGKCFVYSLCKRKLLYSQIKITFAIDKGSLSLLKYSVGH